MRDRVKKYMCTECGIVCSVEKEQDDYTGEEILRCSCCGRVVED